MKLALTPNRITVYLTVFANVTAAVLSVVTDVGATNLIAPVAGINAVALMFLKGWHQFEQANYDAQNLQFQLNARLEQQAAATAPRSSASKLNLSR